MKMTYYLAYSLVQKYKNNIVEKNIYIKQNVITLKMISHTCSHPLTNLVIDKSAMSFFHLVMSFLMVWRDF